MGCNAQGVPLAYFPSEHSGKHPTPTHRGCRRCGAAIQPHPHAGRPRIYCLACVPAADRERKKASAARERTRICERCGSAARRRFCSSACANAATLDGRLPKVRASAALRRLSPEERRRRERESWRARAHRLRALARGAIPVDRISIDVVAARDGWTCGICAQPIDAAISHPDPLSATVDHIWPLGPGQWDLLSNVRLAHRRCNQAEYVRLCRDLELVRTLLGVAP